MNKVTIDRALIEQALEAIELNWKTDEGDAVKPLLCAALAEPAVEPYDHGPQAATTAEALRDVAKWLNERPNRPLDLRHVAMLCAALAEPAVEPNAVGCKCSICGEWQRWTPSGMVCKNGHGGVRGINHRLYTSPPPPAEPAPVPLTTEEYTALAHRIASKYAHRSDPRHIAYTFLPHTLEQFVREVEQLVRRKAGL